MSTYIHIYNIYMLVCHKYGKMDIRINYNNVNVLKYVFEQAQ